jgi:hypothetical protein
LWKGIAVAVCGDGMRDGADFTEMH